MSLRGLAGDANVPSVEDSPRHAPRGPELPGEVLSLIELARAMTGADISGFALLDQTEGSMAYSFTSNLFDHTNFLVVPASSDPLSVAITGRQPVILTDYPSHPTAVRLFVDSGVRAVVAVPVALESGEIGVIVLLHRKPASSMSPTSLSLLLSLMSPFAGSGPPRPQEILARKQTSRDYYVNLLDSLHDEVMVITRDYIISDVNKPFLVRTGFPREQVIGRRCYVVSHRASSPCWQHADHPCPMADVLSHRLPRSVTHVHYDQAGDPLYVHIAASPLMDDQGEVVGVVEAHRDVTNERRLEGRLDGIHQLVADLSSTREPEAILDQVLQILTEELGYDTAACEILDPQSNLSLAQVKSRNPLKASDLTVTNLALLRPFPVPEAEIEVRPPGKGVPRPGRHPGHGFSVPVNLTGRTIGSISVSASKPRAFPPGERHLVETLVNQAAIALESALTFRDLEEKVRMLEEAKTRLFHSEKLAAVGALMAGVAHELNNPLSSILLFAELLLRGNGQQDTRAYGERIVLQAQRASGIIRGLLDLSRKNPLQRVSFDVSEVIKRTVNLMAHELRVHNIECFLSAPDGASRIRGDPSRLEQVLVNLIMNACQAMFTAHKGGCLRISVGLKTSASTTGDQSKSSVWISIKDDGPGIPDAVKAHIFEPFFTTKAEGTGLGLSICRGVIEDHGGQIRVESHIGEGSTFLLELPTSPDCLPGPDPITIAPADSTSPNRARCLLIDDEPAVLEPLARILSGEGLEVDLARNGMEGIGRLADSEHDLIICDLHMPGMDGMTFYQELSARFPSMTRKVIFTTGDLMTPSVRVFLDRIVAPHLAKPFDISDLMTLVRAALSTPAAAGFAGTMKPTAPLLDPRPSLAE